MAATGGTQWLVATSTSTRVVTSSSLLLTSWRHQLLPWPFLNSQTANILGDFAPRKNATTFNKYRFGFPSCYMRMLWNVSPKWRHKVWNLRSKTDSSIRAMTLKYFYLFWYSPTFPWFSFLYVSFESCFLAVQTRVWDSSIPTPVTHWETFYFLTLKSNPRDLWPLRHLIRVMRKHDLTNILTIFFAILTIFDNFQFFFTIFTNSTILTILDNFRQFLIVWTIFESFDIFDNT